jgi:hypothetical protein
MSGQYENLNLIQHFTVFLAKATSNFSGLAIAWLSGNLFN